MVTVVVVVRPFIAVSNRTNNNNSTLNHVTIKCFFGEIQKKQVVYRLDALMINNIHFVH